MEKQINEKMTEIVYKVSGMIFILILKWIRRLVVA